MARFSSRTGTWSGQRSRVNVPLPETVRDERQWHTEMPGGLLRVDFGSPVPRLPSEPQPVHMKGTLKVPQAAPAARPVEPPVCDAPAPQRDHRAITRQP